VIAWLWLDVGGSIVESGAAQATANVGRLAALDYFMRYELPKVDAWLHVVESRDATCRDVPEDAF
jgi:butyryl-CoA dehydrogenase